MKKRKRKKEKNSKFEEESAHAIEPIGKMFIIHLRCMLQERKNWFFPTQIVETYRCREQKLFKDFEPEKENATYINIENTL